MTDLAMRRLLVVGAVGSALVALGGVGVGAVPYQRDPVAEAMGLDVLHRTHAGNWVALVLVVAGILLLAGSWWLLGRRRPRVGEVVRAAALWAAPLLVAPPLFSRDVYAYAGQAALVAAGRDPYTAGPNAVPGPLADAVDPVWRDEPSPYGPVFLSLAARVVAASGDSPYLAVIGLRLLAVLGLVLVAVALPRLAVAHGVDPGRALWLGLANPLLLLHGVGGAHNDALMVGLLVAGMAVVEGSPTTRRFAAGAALVVLAALVKVPAAAALVYLPLAAGRSWGPRIRAAGVVAAAAVVTAAAATAVSGLGLGWLSALDAGTERLSLFSPVTGIGVVAAQVLTALGVVSEGEPVLRLALAGGLALAGSAAVVLLARADRVGPVRALGLTLVAVVLLAPVVQPWYLLWGLVLLAAVAGERAVLALAALSVALCLSLMPNGKSIIRPPFFGLPLVAAAALAAFEVRRATRVVHEDPAHERA